MQPSLGPILSLAINWETRFEQFPKDSKQEDTLRLIMYERGKQAGSQEERWAQDGDPDKGLPVKGAWGDAGATFSHTKQLWALFTGPPCAGHYPSTRLH